MAADFLEGRGILRISKCSISTVYFTGDALNCSIMDGKLRTINRSGWNNIIRKSFQRSNNFIALKSSKIIFNEKGFLKQNQKFLLYQSVGGYSNCYPVFPRIIVKANGPLALLRGVFTVVE